MALFFDQSWFDAKLSALGLTRDEIAAALGLKREHVDEIWKDQRELSARDVTMLAQLLATSPQEIATRAGVSTPVPAATPQDANGRRISEMEARLTHLEREVAELKALLSRKNQ